MGIHDRDYYREAARRGRTSGPTMLQIAIFWILVGGAAFLLLKDRLRPPEQPPRPGPQPSVAAQPSMQQPAPAPVTRPTEPSAPSFAYAPGPGASIYRCGDHYSHDPCPNARVVEAPAATGFDSRPSEKLARLVAEGRASQADTVTSVTTTNIVSNGRATECQWLSSEVDSIDRTARQPQLSASQDRLRLARQRARDRQAALHC